MGYEIRYLGEGPLDANKQAIVRYLDMVCFPSDNRKFGSEHGVHWWIVRDVGDGVLAGYCGIVLSHADRGFLCRAGVMPHARGNGLQRRMIRARERFARTQGWTRLVTYTHFTNTSSANNLIACGYRLYTPDAAWGGSSALYFWRDL